MHVTLLPTHHPFCILYSTIFFFFWIEPFIHTFYIFFAKEKERTRSKMMLRVPLLFVLLPLSVLFFCSSAYTPTNANGAISVSVGNDAVQKFVMAFLPQVEKSLQGLHLPDVKQKKDSIEVDVDGMVLTQVSVGSAAISFDSSGATLSLNGIQVALNAHYKVCEDLIGHNCFCDGGISIRASGSTGLTVTIQVSESGGVPVVTASNPSFSLGNFDLDGLCHLLDWIKDLFESEIKGMAESAIRNTLVSSVENAAKQFISQLTFVYDVTPFLGVDYHMATGINFADKQAEFEDVGGVFDPKTGKHSPYEPSPLSPVTVSGHSLGLRVSDSVGMGVAWTLFYNNLLQFHTNGTGILKDLEVMVNITQQPIISFEKEGVGIMVNNSLLEVMFESAQELALQVDLSFKLYADVMADNQPNNVSIYAQIPEIDIDDIDLEIDILHSIFPISLKDLKPVLNDILKEAIKILNPMLKKHSFPLPSLPMLKIDDVDIEMDDTFMTVWVDASVE
eukprot:TRINITY_DN1061_c0_g1_i1.p2 TRINITY_DN1061_c0_g1~~TRINITY_DN1061_c0_g1_i1.p2  ORF type:complete len:505 (-),score=139.47 TRINITY_DN1061_c0_g1_i1:209-1723(-)